jgi:hypothetical protein
MDAFARAQMWGSTLQAAARDGDAATVDRLLRAGCHPDEAPKDGDDSPRSRGASALVYAARRGDLEVVNRLLAEPNINANLSTTDEETGATTGYTPLHWSVAYGSLSAFMSLLRDPRVDYEAEAHNGFRAIHLAVLKGSAEMVQALLDVRSDPSAKVVLPCGVEVTPLLMAIAGSRPHILAQLAGELPPESLKERVSQFESSLALVAGRLSEGGRDDGELWRCTPANGAPLGVRASPGFDTEVRRTVLEDGELFRVVKTIAGPGDVLFLKLAGDIGWVFSSKPGVGTMCTKEPADSEFWKCTPANGRPLEVRVGPRLDAAKTGEMLKPGAIFRVTGTLRTDAGVLFLKLADGRGWVFNNLPGVGLMCSKGSSEMGRLTYLHYAASRRNVAAVEVLMKAKADPDAPNAHGRTLLQEAVRNACPELVLFLVQLGAETKHVFSDIRRTQILGDTMLLDKMLKVALSKKGSPAPKRTASPKGRSASSSRKSPDPSSVTTLALVGQAGGRPPRAGASPAAATPPGPREISPQDCRLGIDDRVPNLHKAVFQKDHELLKHALKDLGPEKAMREVDGGGLPAVFYAVELGYLDLARTLLVEGHCFTAELADRVLNVVKDKGPTRAPCLRVFQMSCEVVSNGYASGTSQLRSEGVTMFIKPWCASLPALNFFQPRKELFTRFRSLCKASCKRIFEDIDSKAIGPADLRVLEEIGQGLPAEPCRQDDEGLLPLLDWSLGDGGQADDGIPELMAVDIELIACRTLSLLAVALDGIFQADMETLAPKAFLPFPAEGPPACQPRPPKPFSAVQSWLLALPRMDDLDGRMPRAMENIDMLRCDFVCDRPEVLKAVVAALSNRYRVLSARNTHAPSPGGSRGAERVVTLHVAYEPSLAFGDVFGHGRLSSRKADGGPSLHAEDENAKAWIRYTSALGEPDEWAMALLPLFKVAQEQIAFAAEVNITFRPYTTVRSFTELLQQVSSCEGGPTEMVSAFYDGQFEQNPEARGEENVAREVVQGLAKKARPQHSPPGTFRSPQHSPKGTFRSLQHSPKTV